VKRAIRLGLIVAGLAVLAFGGRAGLRSLSFFSIRRVELVGARYLDAGSVARALELDQTANLFDPKGPWVARVKTLPGVIDATVSRRIPGTLRVRVTESEPIALAEKGDRLVLVDEFGSILPFDPARPASDLPLANADSLVTRLLGRIRDVDPELFGRIQRGSRVRSDVALDLDEGRVFLRADAAAGDIEALSVVASVLSREGRSWRELDGRFPPRIVVRGGKSA
jgi:cell division septal protein FtsQ